MRQTHRPRNIFLTAGENWKNRALVLRNTAHNLGSVMQVERQVRQSIEARTLNL